MPKAVQRNIKEVCAQWKAAFLTSRGTVHAAIELVLKSWGPMGGRWDKCDSTCSRSKAAADINQRLHSIFRVLNHAGSVLRVISRSRSVTKIQKVPPDPSRIIDLSSYVVLLHIHNRTIFFYHNSTMASFKSFQEWNQTTVVWNMKLSKNSGTTFVWQGWAMMSISVISNLTISPCVEIGVPKW